MRRKNILVYLSVFVLFSGVFAALSARADDGWTEMRGLSGKVRRVYGIDGTDMIYAGTDDGIYVTIDNGVKWERRAAPGEMSGVKDIAITDVHVFAAADGGLYGSGRSRSGRGKELYDWKRIPGRKEVDGVAVFPWEGTDGVIAWSGEEIFLIADGSWKDVGPSIIGRDIACVACAGSVVFAAADDRVLVSRDCGKTWIRVLLFGEVTEDDPVELSGFGEEWEAPEFVRDMVPLRGERVAVATGKGIYIVEGSGTITEKIDTTGLPAAGVEHVAYAGGTLFSATDNAVFRYMPKNGEWRRFFDRPFPDLISRLEGHRDSSGKVWLWVAAGERLYRVRVQFPPTAPEAAGKAEFSCDVPVREVQRMAVEYAEVSPEKIKRWRTGARWKAVMPKVSVSFSESCDENVEIYKSATTSYVVRGPWEKGNDWGVDLSWDLSDLVWNDAQTSIDVRSKLMVQLRDDILEEVTRLYFERKRLVAEIAAAENDTVKDISGKTLRIEELTAYIDALTGGRFSEAGRNKIILDKKPDPSYTSLR